MTTTALAPLTTRTYGQFRHVPPGQQSLALAQAGTDTSPHGYWALKCEAAVAMRVRRTFGRVKASRHGELFFAHTKETARDLEWFMERYPLEPRTPESAEVLREAAARHRDMEATVHQVLSGERRGDLPAEPTCKPREYQLVALDLLRATGGLLLTDDLGLGKTLTGSLNFLHADGLPALVVAPTHLASAKSGRWVEELDEHFPFLTYHVLKQGTPYDLRDPDGTFPDVVISTYNKLAGWADTLAGLIRYVVFDEVQELRNGVGTAKGRAAAQIAERASYRMGLTATPVYNYAGEVWNIVDTLTEGILGTKDEFSREWGATAWGSHIKVESPHALGSYLREQGAMLGRTRADVGRELPTTVKVTQTVASDPAALDAVAGDAAAMAKLILDQHAGHIDRFHAAGELDMVMRQATGIAKAPYVAEFCRLLLDSEQKIILFGWHRAVYDIWLDRLKEFNPVLYTGSETPNQKAQAIARFKSDDAWDSSRVLIMSLRSGAGVDGLQKHTRVAVFGELDWSPQVHEQGIGRLRRDGMGDDPALAYFLISEEGSDPAIAEVLQVKRQQGEQLVSPDGRLLSNATTDLNRTRLLAEAALARVGQPLPTTERKSA